MASPQLTVTRKNPLDSFDLAIAKRTKSVNGVEGPVLLEALQNITSKSKSRSSEANQLVAVPSVPPPSICSDALQGTSKCPMGSSNEHPCPDQRQVLADTATAIAQHLLRKFRAAPAPENSATVPAAKISSCVHCGGDRPCGPGCSCPCHGFFAPKTCAETLRKGADEERKGFGSIPEPPDPETITDCKPQQLRAGKFLTLCDCTKRNGLQHLCRRWGCSEKCPQVRPKQRKFAIGDPVPVLDSTPRCCAGKMQAEMYRMMEAKVDEMMRKTRNTGRCEKPIPPLELPQPPAFNWNGNFPHVCRRAGDACRRRPKPFPKIPCSPGCKHWSMPRPCTYPTCRANCYEDPPPKPPKPDLADLSLTIKPYQDQETC